MGHGMAEAVDRHPCNMESQVQSHAIPSEICGGGSFTGTGFASSTSDFPRQFHSTVAP